MSKNRIKSIVSVFVLAFYLIFIGSEYFAGVSSAKVEFDSYKWQIKEALLSFENVCLNDTVSRASLLSYVQSIIDYSHIGKNVFERYALYDVESGEIISSNCFMIRINDRNYLSSVNDPERKKTIDNLLANFNSEYNKTVTEVEYYLENDEKVFTSLTVREGEDGKQLKINLSEPKGEVKTLKLMNKAQLNWDTPIPDGMPDYEDDHIYYWFPENQPENKEFYYINLNLDTLFINKTLFEMGEEFDEILLNGSGYGKDIIRNNDMAYWVRNHFELSDGKCVLFYAVYQNPYRDAGQVGTEFYLFNLLFMIMAWVLIYSVPLLYEKNKLYEQSRSAFTAAAAHELKTPIAVIANSAECIMENVSPEKNEKYVRNIYDESLRMGRLVNSLMQYNRLSSGKSVRMRKCNLSEITLAEVEKYRTVAEEKGVDIQTDICKKARVKADSELIALVIDNYLSNAVKHTQKGDTIKISLQLREIYGSFRLSVFNEGEQIPAEHIDKIWNVLYRADEVRNSEDNSSGMGLAISKQILEIHKCVYGAINKADGVEFYFDLKQSAFWL